MPFCAYCGTPVNAVSYAACATCSNPTNGAPKRTVSGGGTSAAVIVAVVVGVAVVALAIVGILAAIAIPNLLTAMQRSKQKRTITDMQSIAMALEAYGQDNHRYPDAVSIDQLSQALSPKYINHVPTKDGWGNPMRYDCWNQSGSGACDTYVIVSAGKDDKFELDDPTKYQGRGATTNFDDDIVFKNGKFIQFPEGISSH
jgi:type II secretory pathway pseudopilin PulG